MKDWYWIPVFLVIIGTAFLPVILKSKCPKCKQRKIVQIEDSADENEKYTYYFHCQSCQTKFKRVKSGPLQEDSQ